MRQNHGLPHRLISSFEKPADLLSDQKQGRMDPFLIQSIHDSPEQTQYFRRLPTR